MDNINDTRTITVEIRDVYGRQTVYPACPTADKFSSLAGTKTLSPRDLKTIQSLGYTVEIKQRELT